MRSVDACWSDVVAARLFRDVWFLFGNVGILAGDGAIVRDDDWWII